MRPALFLSLLLALVLAACTATAAQPPIPEPREFAVPASCRLADANVRGTALYRKSDLVTTISPLETAQARLTQFARGDECP